MTAPVESRAIGLCVVLAAVIVGLSACALEEPTIESSPPTLATGSGDHWKPTDLIPELADEIDFAVNEQYEECDTYAPLIALDKPVFNIEYQGSCEGQPDRLSTLLADLLLDGPTTSCR